MKGTVFEVPGQQPNQKPMVFRKIKAKPSQNSDNESDD